MGNAISDLSVEQIANRLKMARTEAKLSQNDVAFALGVTKATISRYESASRAPEYKILLRLKHCGINPLYVLIGAEPKFIEVEPLLEEQPTTIFCEFKVNKKYKGVTNKVLKKFAKTLKNSELDIFLNKLSNFLDTFDDTKQ